MLRRKPTALTITNEDIAAFEEAHLRRLAYAKYLKTGADPDGLFRNSNNNNNNNKNNNNGAGQGPNGTTSGGVDAGAGAQVAIDPNDELKPLPGDKARIVRSREERIMGAGGGGR